LSRQLLAVVIDPIEDVLAVTGDRQDRGDQCRPGITGRIGEDGTHRFERRSIAHDQKPLAVDVEAQRMLLPLRVQDQEDEADLLIGDRHPGPAVGARI
jgi:hypothetical protein